jgi:hypothetical protein
MPELPSGRDANRDDCDRHQHRMISDRQRVTGAVLSTAIAVGTALTIHAPATGIESLAVAIVQFAFEVAVIRNIINRTVVDF